MIDQLDIMVNQLDITTISPVNHETKYNGKWEIPL